MAARIKGSATYEIRNGASAMHVVVRSTVSGSILHLHFFHLVVTVSLSVFHLVVIDSNVLQIATMVSWMLLVVVMGVHCSKVLLVVHKVVVRFFALSRA